ncbi:MAG: type II toxin-antitoxin system RelE/ParE family toxin [Acidobacteria bacterium]|nr:type II toxin-antitoxin system RelE/ParE family toxin [Acidobacteriota bacterium]
MKIRWTQLAVEDLDSAYDYIAETNPTAARSVIARIESALKALKAHPLLGRKGRVEDTRELVVPATPFIVAYRIGKGRIEILAVIHAARRWPERF